MGSMGRGPDTDLVVVVGEGRGEGPQGMSVHPLALLLYARLLLSLSRSLDVHTRSSTLTLDFIVLFFFFRRRVGGAATLGRPDLHHQPHLTSSSPLLFLSLTPRAEEQITRPLHSLPSSGDSHCSEVTYLFPLGRRRKNKPLTALPSFQCAVAPR